MVDENLVAGGVLVIAGLLTIVLGALDQHPVVTMVVGGGLAMIVGILFLNAPRRFRT